MQTLVRPPVPSSAAGGAPRAAGYADRLAAITGVGLLLRLALLAHQPLWRDEAFSAIAVQQSLPRMLAIVRADSAPPLAYLVDHAIVALWSSPAGLRLLSLLAGTAGIVVAGALGRRLAGGRGGLLAAALYAVAPATFLSSLDARMYATASTLVLAATLLLWRALERPTWPRWCLYAACITGAVYTDYFAVLAVVAQVLTVLFVVRPGRRRAAAAIGCAALAGAALLPWVLAARGQLAHAGQAFWVPPVGVTTVGGALVQFFSGPPIDPWIPGRYALQTLQGLAMAAGVLLGFALWWWRERLGPAGRRALRFCLACGLGGVLLLLLLSAWRPLVDGRYASVLWGPLFPVLGAGLAVVPWRRAGVAALAITALCSLTLAAAPTHPDTQDAVSLLAQKVRGHDLVDAYPSEYLLLRYYGTTAVLARTQVLQADVPWFWGTAAYPPGAVIGAAAPSVAANNGTIWYVAQPQDPGPTGLPRGYQAGARRCWTGICVTPYTRG